MSFILLVGYFADDGAARQIAEYFPPSRVAPSAARRDLSILTLLT